MNTTTNERPANRTYGEQDANGVDLTLIRHMLSLTPRERLEQMNAFAAECVRLLEAGRRHRERRAADLQREPVSVP